MKKSLWERPNCNLCGSKNYGIMHEKLSYWEYEGIFRIVKCKQCSLVYLHPRPPVTEIGKYYESENYFGRDIAHEQKLDDAQTREEVFSPAYDVIFKKKKKGKILDIGAGTGLFLSKFKEKGWDVDGIEITSDAVKYAKKFYNVRLRQGDFFDFSLPKGAYDVVALNGALEHMHHPLETLMKSHEYLKKGGLVILSVPNVEGLGRHIFKKNWFPWQPPRHLYHFSPKTARMILEKAGFESIVIKHTYAVQNSYILFQSMRYSKSPKFALKETGGLIDQALVEVKSSSLKVKLGKHIWKLLVSILAKLEEYIGRGEVILVYAKKA